MIKHKAAFYYYTAFAYFPPIRALLFAIWIFGKPTLLHTFFLLNKFLYAPPRVKTRNTSREKEFPLRMKYTN